MFLKLQKGILEWLLTHHNYDTEDTGVMATENSSLAITEINNILIYIKVNIFILSVNSYFKQ